VTTSPEPDTTSSDISRETIPDGTTPGGTSGTRETFVAGWGTVLTTAGVAIGLGNVWRFPYMMGSYGGAAFLLLYLALVVAFGIPALVCEQALGRATRRGPLGALRAAGLPGASFWGWLLLVTVTMAASYYGVVVAWVLDFTVLAAFGHAADPGGFGDLTASATRQVPAVLATVAIACLALHLGVRRGIQRISRAVLPVFFLLFLVLIGRSLTLPGAVSKLLVYLTPRWDQVTGEVVLAALGQAFFSLALGGTFMVTYGSYLSRAESLPRTATATALTDAAAALAAALVVVPAVLALGLDMESGPSLLFVVLPEVFGRLPAGSVFAVLFYLSVFLVALLSLMAAYEVVVAALVDHAGWSRGRALAVLGFVQLVLSVPAMLGPQSYIGWSDFVWGSTMQVLGGAVAVVALAWSYGRGEELATVARNTVGVDAIHPLLVAWVRWGIPLGILATLVYGWWERWVR
jgi:NSS family neurotransmitter:Na+ symporter